MRKKPPTAASANDVKLAEVRRLGREALDRWQRIAAADPDAMTWARQIADAVDAETVRCLIAEYRRLANDARLDPIDKAEASLRKKALTSFHAKRPGKTRR